MKALSSFYTLLAAPLVLSCSVLAEDKPGVLAEYLPYDGTMIKGHSVRAVLDESFTAEQNKLLQHVQKLTNEQKKAFLEKLDPNCAFDYDPDYWESKEDYDKYLAAWKKSKVTALNEVMLGLQPAGEGIWEVLSLTQVAKDRTLPLTISALRYDAKRNMWISNNGELTAKDYVTNDRFAFGVQRGTEWKLEEENSLTKLAETVRVTKSADGLFVYVLYTFTEQLPSTGDVIAQAAYILRFPVTSAAASMSKPGQK